jgi:transcriptional regulator with XRE-family HTH domain
MRRDFNTMIEETEVINNEALCAWLQGKLDEMGWTRYRLAQETDLSNAALSKIWGNKASPGFEFCTRVAWAFKIDPNEVYFRAGLIPKKAEVDGDYLHVKALLDGMTEERRRQVVEYAEMQLQKADQEKKNASRGTPCNESAPMEPVE